MTTPAATTPARDLTTARFGTFAGVFTPNVLTILGIILFLRIGWVVGQAGLWGALIIVAIANMISFLTGLSLSAIATAMDVKAGGNYYLISRSLGLEIGGAIGIPLYLSQAISVAFYIIGFTEAILSVPFFQAFDPRLISTVVAVIFAGIAYIGADFALRIQFFILAILVAALISFFAGGWDSIQAPVTQGAFTGGISFWVVFAVFFPAVTGIEVGTSLSGDLKDPSHSIPRGTILSIVVTAVVYFAVVIWFAVQLPADVLIGDNLAISRVARWPQIILAGVSASTLSSALGSVLAAPRTLQAIANDNVVPRWMASRMGSPTEPRMAVLLTALIAIGIIWLGDLNFVAPIITMFFLNTYGMVNLAAAIERLVKNPSFRPRFKIPWYVSLLGAIGCYGAMFLIEPAATVVAIVISYGIFFYLERRQIQRTWGDVRTGIWLTVARQALLRLDEDTPHIKNWRPNIMVFTGQPHNRQQLTEIANWLSAGHGIVTFFQLIVGDVDLLVGRQLRSTALAQIRRYIRENNMEAFAEVEVVSDFREGALTVVQAHGVGGLESNVVLMGWSRTEDGRALQMDLTRKMFALGKSVLFLNYDEERGFGRKATINVWWQGRSSNGDLMLLLAHLLQQHRDWNRPRIRLLTVVDSSADSAEAEARLHDILRAARVNAEPVVIVQPQPPRPIPAIITDHSRDADLTILGMQLPAIDQEKAYSERVSDLVSAVGSVLLVRNAILDEDLLGG